MGRIYHNILDNGTIASLHYLFAYYFMDTRIFIIYMTSVLPIYCF